MRGARALAVPALFQVGHGHLFAAQLAAGDTEPEREGRQQGARLRGAVECVPGGFYLLVLLRCVSGADEGRTAYFGKACASQTGN